MKRVELFGANACVPSTRRGRARPWIVSLVLLCAAFSLTPAHADTATVVQPVLGFQQALIEAMKNGPALGFEGRKKHMQTLVDSHFDMSAISRAVIGRHYASMPVDVREGLHAQINEFAVATLAARFRRFNGERFAQPVLRASRDQRARLSGQFIQAAGETTDLTYDVHEANGRWKITNISFGGVSGTDIQRAEFEIFLRDGGAARLRKALDDLISDLARDKG